MPDEIKIEEGEQTSSEESPSKGEKKAKKKIEDLQEQLFKKESEVKHWQNEFYRAYADTKNLRSKLEKEHKDIIKYRIEGFVDELLPILDSFQSVLAQEVEDPNLKNYLIGFQYVYRNLINVLENEGVSVIAPKIDDKFDANIMDAVDTLESEKDNVVTKIYSNGYKLHDHLIRPAKVQVSVSKKEEKLDA